MAAGWPLPKTILCHGWLTVDGEKMSKTLGNVVNPLKLADDLGVDALRYFLLRESSMGEDWNFSHEALINRYNAELANDLGNLLNRTLSMVHKYKIEPISTADGPNKFDTLHHINQVAALVEDFQLSRALEHIWTLIGRGNWYIDTQAPWKPESDRVQILGDVLELCRVVSHLLAPFLPERSTEMRRQLGVDEPPAWPTFSARRFSPAVATPLFPRVEDDRRAELLGRWMAKPPAAAAAGDSAGDGASGGAATVSFDEFQKLDLRVAQVLAAEPIPKAKKLLKLTVDLGSERRQVVAGIAESYQPADLVGKKVILLANLQPATIRGVVSQGMILAAGDEQVVALSALDRDTAVGTKVR
jgi:methionyl-tRNA synthetase